MWPVCSGIQSHHDWSGAKGLHGGSDGFCRRVAACKFNFHYRSKRRLLWLWHRRVWHPAKQIPQNYICTCSKLHRSLKTNNRDFWACKILPFSLSTRFSVVRVRVGWGSSSKFVAPIDWFQGNDAKCRPKIENCLPHISIQVLLQACQRTSKVCHSNRAKCHGVLRTNPSPRVEEQYFGEFLECSIHCFWLCFRKWFVALPQNSRQQSILNFNWFQRHDLTEAEPLTASMHPNHIWFDLLLDDKDLMDKPGCAMNSTRPFCPAWFQMTSQPVCLK